MIAPSCPALVIHDDDTFRKSLIAALDQRHFTVTFSDDRDAVRLLAERSYRIVLLGIDVKSRKGLDVLEHLSSRDRKATSLIIVGEPDPELRTYGKTADETLLKPVDAAYVAERARVYCS
jgi:DNA-binding response OmpR family regulator